jgi:hypothetical protein
MKIVRCKKDGFYVVRDNAGDVMGYKNAASCPAKVRLAIDAGDVTEVDDTCYGVIANKNI